MTSTPFDYRLRTLGCPSCGAPLVAPREGGQICCEYCSTVSRLTARQIAPRAGQRSSLAEETARLSRLKAQLEHPVAGHPYDLIRTPSGFDRGEAGGPAFAERLFSEWSHALREPPVSRIEVQRRTCWMALQAASIAQRTDPLRTRALLETTLGWLEDEGYRHLVRCRLAQAALEDGDLDAAEGWLAECDLAPEVLELDSASRLTRAWLACRKHRADEVLDLLGDEGTDLPIVLCQQDEARRLRVDAFEALKRREQAYRGFDALARKNGLDAESACFMRHRLAPETVQRVRQDWQKEELAAAIHRLAVDAQARLEKLRSEIYQVSKRRQSFTARSATVPVRWLPLAAAVLTIPVLVVRCSADTDPLGGTYGYVLCPSVCEECQGPVRTVTRWTQTGSSEWSSDGPQYFCETPSNRVGEMTTEELESQMWHLSRYELGAFSALAASYLILLIALLPFGVLLSINKAINNRVKDRALSIELEGLVEQLGEPSPPPPSNLYESLRSTAISLGVAGLLAFALSWWTL